VEFTADATFLPTLFSLNVSKILIIAGEIDAFGMFFEPIRQCHWYAPAGHS
jgi:hypothetical protein